MQEKFKSQIFSKDFHNKSKKNVEKNYRDFIEDLREDFSKGFSTDVVDQDFLDQLADILSDESLDTYSPLKFYWMNLIDNLIYVIQLHEELLGDNEIDSNELTELEDELFTIWNDSELAESFLNYLNDGAPIIEASNNLVPLLENQIIAFYVLHINEYRQEFSDALVYQTVPELGDYDKKIYLTDTHKEVKISKLVETFPAIPLLSIEPEINKVTIETNDSSFKTDLLQTKNFLQVDELKLYVLPNCEAGERKIEEFKKNISTALSNIKKVAPHLHEVFRSFTHTIVPVNEKGIVSYSMQSLPGYSSINMFDRDQIDLMDDLLHENGHHYLNTFLNYQDLINEDDDKIYYSPWRKALRPIRGIYHATFTFFWALELFNYLDQAANKKVIPLNAEQKIKIKSRFLEEYYMLDYCKPDLVHGFKNKKITKEGNQLIESIYERISSYKKNAEDVLNQLSKLDSESHKKILDLKNELTKTRQHYKL